MKVLGLDCSIPSGYVVGEPSYGGILGAAFNPERIRERQEEERLIQYVSERAGFVFDPGIDSLH
jgi:hypothetical protein